MWHVVCRGCSFERLEEYKRDAIREAALHTESDGHDTEFGRIDGDAT